jgi:hypothetical protein
MLEIHAGLSQEINSRCVAVTCGYTTLEQITRTPCLTAASQLGRIFWKLKFRVWNGLSRGSSQPLCSRLETTYQVSVRVEESSTHEQALSQRQ